MSLLDWAEKEIEIACKRENPDRKEGGWDYDCDEDDFPKMYYKKDSRVVGWSRNLNEEGVVKEYKKLDEGCGITIPYFEEVNYSELVHKVISSNIDFGNVYG